MEESSRQARREMTVLHKEAVSDHNEFQETEEKKEIVQKTFVCKACSSSFARKDNLKRHMLLKHKIQTNRLDDSETKTRCFHPGCTAEFYHQTRLIKHIEEIHQIPVETETLSFKSHEAFVKWKEKEEKDNFLYFSKSSGTRQGKRVSYVYYKCQRDGPARAHKKTGEPARRTKRRNKKGVTKTGMVCPARMQVRVDPSGSTVVNYFKTHSHPINLEDTIHHPVSNNLKDEIKCKLLFGFSVDDIQKGLREGLSSRSSRDHSDSCGKRRFVSKRFIDNIRRTLRTSHNVNFTTTLEFNAKILSLQQESYNPVLIYKSKAGDIISELCREILPEIPYDTMLLGIQTREQREVLERFGSRLLYFDKTHSELGCGFVIVFVMVVDEYHKGYTVASFVTNSPTEDVLSLFLRCMKERMSSSFCCNAVIICDDDNMRRAVQRIFVDISHVMLCKWHVLKTWTRAICDNFASLEERKETLYFLIKILSEKSVHKFEELCTTFVKTLAPFHDSFVQLFTKHYFSKRELWMAYLMTDFDVEIHIPAFLEVFHKRLKPLFLMPNRDNVLDNILSFLLNSEEDDYYRRQKSNFVAEHSFVSVGTRHTMALQIPDENVSSLSDCKWCIQSPGKGRHATVSKVADICDTEDCYVTCLVPPCYLLCDHLYTCTCDDARFLCLHIHKVHSMLIRKHTVDRGDVLPIFLVGNECQMDSEEEKDPSVEDGTLATHPSSDDDLQEREMIIKRMKQNIRSVCNFLDDGTRSTQMLRHADVKIQQILENLRSDT